MSKLGLLVTPDTRSREEFGKMFMLPMVHHVEDDIGVPLLHSVTNGSQVRCCVEKCAVAFLDDHGRIEGVEENAQSAVGLRRKASTLEFFDDFTEPRLVEALTQFVVESDV